MNDTNTRLTVLYAGLEYYIRGRSLQEVQADIAAAFSSDESRWLGVSVGQGRATEAQLLLGRGIPIAIWAVNTDGDPAHRESAPPTEPVTYEG